VSFAIHQFFNQNHFFYMNTPIITGADAEGAGEMFGVTNFDLNQIPRDENGDIDFAQDFFGKKTNLTVSGQLKPKLQQWDWEEFILLDQLSVLKILILLVTLPNSGW
jgi:aspartyl/asparaginyl-tRNA synthetase